ncbi:hypothetical protein CANARDRAFT_8983 [[Candida] arabinofermentans NRRL YB-2248]|uniref:SPS-sensor component PTR3 n=1 Tax=[Candida] arabinofermentans NRRL YB-2248 TaxID=983967 RepID=A0A1E4SWY3_9ASCO|nr:hypothetical protein CANARDRAFT_8983 [[Candida] arabinofermentans NRRL YB-2248]
MAKPTLISIVDSIEQILTIPSTFDYSQDPPILINKVSDDCSILSCGCLISENLAKQLAIPIPTFNCPVCQTQTTLLKSCDNLRDLHKLLISLKTDFKDDDQGSLSLGRRRRSSSKKIPPNNISLLSAFHEVINEVSNGTNANPTTTTTNNTNNGNSSSNNKISPINDDINSKHSKMVKTNVQDWISMMKLNEEMLDPLSTIPIPIPMSIPTNQSGNSSLNSIQRQKTKTSFQSSSNFSKFLSSSPTFEKSNSRKNSITHQQQQQQNSLKIGDSDNTNTNKELLFAKNFPFYRKLYQYNLHHSNFFLKQKLFINTGISPNLTKLILLSEKKWEVYQIDPNLPDIAPQLISCGKNNGDYGINFENLIKAHKDDIILDSNFVDNPTESIELLNNWEHLFCKITDNLIIISGTRGFVRVLDLNSNGKVLYTYQCKFPIRCIDVSPNEEFISLGVTGKDKYTGIEQAFIILLRLQLIGEEFNNSDMMNGGVNEFINDDFIKPREFEDLIKPITSSSMSGRLINNNNNIEEVNNKTNNKYLKITTFPFTLPYRDPINILQFSPDSQYLSVATAMESRFLAISIVDPNKPVLVMKSQRKLDTSLESEGITDLQFFPDNRLMTLTSVSYNSVPIIIDTKITSISGPEGIARPRLLLKIDEIGHTIHKCCVSPRGDSIAYLDRSGLVYVVTSPRMDDSDNKRIVIVTDVSNAYRVRESAYMRFDKDGYKLYILDRKGVLTISDFTAGTVEDHSVTRCKIVN